MYRRPKFLEVLLEIRQEMAREADYDVDLFAEMVRAGKFSADRKGGELINGDVEKQKQRTGDELLQSSSRLKKS